MQLIIASPSYNVGKDYEKAAEALWSEFIMFQEAPLPEVSPATPDSAGDWVQEAMNWLSRLDAGTLKWIGIGAGALLVISVASRKIHRAIRRRRPPRIHPLLQKYAGDSPVDPKKEDELIARRRAEAARIVATSSSDAVAGYDVIEQIEAVFVDGFRRPEDALEGLKAVAAMKGANAVIRVKPDRAPNGRFTASGDAVIVRKMLLARHAPPPAPSEARPPAGDAPIITKPPPTPDEPEERPT